MNTIVDQDSLQSILDRQTCGLYGQSVLVADDEPSIRALNAHILKSTGLNPCTAGCGSEAVEIFTQKHGDFAAVVLDIDMPGMTGFELCELLRESNPDLPVIFASGAGTHDVKARIKGIPGACYLPKPYGLKQLLHLVRDTVCTVRCEAYRERGECMNPAFAAV